MNTTGDLENALINAAHDGELNAVRDLLARGVDANCTDADDRTPFNQALKRGIFYECINVCCNGAWESQVLAYRSIIELLLAHGATLHAVEKHAALPAPAMQKMMRERLKGKSYTLLISDVTLARKFLCLLPQTLTEIQVLKELRHH